ncbi:ABC transporter ATP-binding protein [Candidatus Cryosericum septentrionale]|jgi:branched-chain amino acid transport system ATP-binding protein|uniref:ABC transporter ATP-binding protein n=1 Tax=Candidatus Cryosericum septentrionale TaxID=2290913 RepID=A0A398DKU7_9BACT|nr:ABC transporter ATP-binding protein [Candidatus Cryosericum septentrionale]RIE16182.1 ABC transporter ATP-binding protein [Candidatus Cryosericum septentrionale]
MALLDVQHLTQFFGGLRAVSDFNIQLEHGEIVGLIGPNGAGKTTVFNVMTGVYTPTKGTIVFDGQNIVGRKTYQITQAGIARTFQTIRLFSKSSVIDNIKIAYHFRMSYGNIDAFLHTRKYWEGEQLVDDYAIDLLRLFHLEGHAEDVSGSLPYGAQRRLEIARALATKPKLLILDEPAAGMNPAEADELMEMIHWLREKFDLTILLIEHQMRVVMGVCERIKVMDFGETICEGVPEYIRNDPRVCEAYLGKGA